MSPTIIGVLSVFYTLLGVSLFVPILAGLYTRAGRSEALAAIACGIVSVLAVQVLTAGRGVGWLTPALAGQIAALAGFLVMLAARSLFAHRDVDGRAVEG